MKYDLPRILDEIASPAHAARVRRQRTEVTMKLSVVVPARDEEGSIEQTVAEIAAGLERRADSV